MDRVRCIIDDMDDIIKGDLKTYSSYYRTKYRNVMVGFGDILNNILMTEERIGRLERYLDKDSKIIFANLHKNINRRITSFGDYEKFDFDHIEQASSIKELYHRLWVLFKEMLEVYKDPYTGLDDKDEDTALLEVRIYAFEKCLDLIQEVYDAYNSLEEKLKLKAKPVWNRILTDLTKSDEYDNFHLIVNVRKNNDLRIYSDNRKIISCSYFNQDHTQLFRNDCVGFCYGLNERHLLGMSPSDCGLASVRMGDSKKYELVFGSIRVSDDMYLEGITSDFLPYYSPQQLQESNSYNEIVLRGDAEPIAIYAPVESIESMYSEIVAASALYRLPVVIYDRTKNKIRVLPEMCLTSKSETPDLE